MILLVIIIIIRNHHQRATVGLDYDDDDNLDDPCNYHSHLSCHHLTNGRSVKAPDMTRPMVFEIPTTGIRNAAELAVTPDDNDIDDDDSNVDDFNVDDDDDDYDYYDDK